MRIYRTVFGPAARGAWLAAVLIATMVGLAAPLAVADGVDDLVGRSARLSRKDVLKVRGYGKEKLRLDLRVSVHEKGWIGTDSEGTTLSGPVVPSGRSGRKFLLMLDELSRVRLETHLSRCALALVGETVAAEFAGYEADLEVAEERVAAATQAWLDAQRAHREAAEADAERSELDRLYDLDRAALSAQGMEIESAEEAEEALELFVERNRPAVRILDGDFLGKTDRRVRKLRVKGKFVVEIQPVDKAEPFIGKVKIKAKGRTVAPLRVLLLGDGDPGSSAQVGEALVRAGHEVSHGGDYWEWDTVEHDPEDHDVVVWLEGDSYGSPLIPTSEEALLAFVAGGGGLIRTEWGGYSAEGYEDEPLNVLLPAKPRAGSPYGYEPRWTVSDARHPLAFGLPRRFRGDGGFSYLDLAPKATSPLSGYGVVPMAAVSDESGGRVVHVNHDITYTTDEIAPTILDLLVNAVEYAGDL